MSRTFKDSQKPHRRLSQKVTALEKHLRLLASLANRDRPPARGLLGINMAFDDGRGEGRADGRAEAFGEAADLVHRFIIGNATK